MPRVGFKAGGRRSKELQCVAERARRDRTAGPGGQGQDVCLQGPHCHSKAGTLPQREMLVFFFLRP